MTSLLLPLVAMGYAIYITLRLSTTQKRLRERLSSNLDTERSILLEPKDLAFRIISVAILITTILMSQIPLQQVGLTSQNVVEDIFIGIGLGFALRHFLNLALSRMRVIGSEKTGCNLILKSILPRSNLQRWLLITVVLPIGGFLEELYFRGILIGGLSPFAGLYVAVLISILFFAFSHIVQGRLGVLGSGLSGAVLAITFMWRNSLLPLFMAHYVGDLEPLSRLSMVQQPNLKALTVQEGKIVALTPDQLKRLLEGSKEKCSCC